MITREEIQEAVNDAHDVNGAFSSAPPEPEFVRQYVRAELLTNHPELETRTVRRNGKTHLELDYILEDLHSYGPTS